MTPERFAEICMHHAMNKPGTTAQKHRRELIAHAKDLAAQNEQLRQHAGQILADRDRARQRVTELEGELAKGYAGGTVMHRLVGDWQTAGDDEEH